VFRPRPGGQSEVLEYRSGKMGVSAVPGSGKTQTLSRLAAQLIEDGAVGPGQEVLVVTFANSAVQNFDVRIRAFLDEDGFLPIGFRIRTLHGLGHDILRERPGLVGLADDFQILDERSADSLLLEAAQTWVRAHPEVAQDYLEPGLEESSYRKAYVDDWPNMVKTVAQAFIKTAKDMQASPAVVRRRLEEAHAPLPLVEMGLEIYSDYQRALSYRGAVDFDDLIRLGLETLKQDDDYLARLRKRWPYILEDEAQDSNLLQQEILQSLAGEKGNWVRVGDPNQAIYETFTTASPRFLREFIAQISQTPELLYSGRSTSTILDLANALVRWTRDEHPVLELRDALADTLIRATPLGDPQPNPPDDPTRVAIMVKGSTPEKEVQLVTESIQKWRANPSHTEETLAILAFSNERGTRFIEKFTQLEIPFVEVLRSSQQTRQAAKALSSALHCLAEPTMTLRLEEAYRDWLDFRSLREPENAIESRPGAQAIHRLSQHETYLWSSTWADLPALAALRAATPAVFASLEEFREVARRWQSAVFLPVDQLVLTIAPDLFTTPVDLALAHKIAGVLRSERDLHANWGLKELAEEMDRVARNRSKLIGFSDEDSGFDPNNYKGRVVVATIHRAKGLEWDRVYLTSVNNYDFPSALPADQFLSEKWFIRGRLNLEAETIARLRALLRGDAVGWNIEPGEPTRQARVDVAAERMRLLYVGITRARKELIITWNTGRQNDTTEAAPLAALHAFLEERQREFAG
jgi:DNA helicase II / ATP-dependent DNA helicase PcrA